MTWLNDELKEGGGGGGNLVFLFFLDSMHRDLLIQAIDIDTYIYIYPIFFGI